MLEYIEEYGPPSPEEYGQPPPVEYGPPPSGDYKPLVVKNYIPHNVFTHFVNPSQAEDYVTHEHSLNLTNRLNKVINS